MHKNLHCPVHVEILYDMDTQHLPILITLTLAESITIPRLLQKRIDWASYSKLLEEITIGHLTTADKVEATACLNLDKMIQAKDKATKHAPPSPPRRDEIPRDSGEITEIEENRLWARSRCAKVKTELNKLTLEISLEVEFWRGATWDARIDEAADHSTKLHALNRLLTNAPSPSYPLLDAQGCRRFAPADRAEILAEHLEVQFSPHPVANNASNEIHAHHALASQ